MQTINQGLVPELFDALMEKVLEVPFYNHLGFEVERVSEGTAVVGMKTLPAHSNIDASIHGGVMMALADAAMATAVRTMGTGTTTVELDTEFLRHGTVGERLTAEGRVIKFGQRIVFCACSVICAGKEVAAMKGTFFRTGPLMAPKA